MKPFAYPFSRLFGGPILRGMVVLTVLGASLAGCIVVPADGNRRDGHYGNGPDMHQQQGHGEWDNGGDRHH